jgi:hypothetical protein
MSSISRVRDLWNENGSLPNWAPELDLHVEIEGAVVGLIPCEGASSEALDVYIDLGEHADDAILRRLLERNVRPGSDDDASFGLHPLTGRIVYRSRVMVDERFTVAQLLARATALAHTGRQALQHS